MARSLQPLHYGHFINVCIQQQSAFHFITAVRRSITKHNQKSKTYEVTISVVTGGVYNNGSYQTHYHVTVTLVTLASIGNFDSTSINVQRVDDVM